MGPWFESLLFGAANSLHCACMCGPLALLLHGGVGGAISYHLGRALSYGALGLVLGATGAVFGAASLGAPGTWVPFVLAAGLLVLALVGERGALSIPGLGRALQFASSRSRALPPRRRALLLGALTPLLPCGLLWSACAGATVAGSAVGGGIVMAGFTLGSLPLLLLAQTQARPLARRLGPRTLAWLARAAMLLAAVVLVLRGLAAPHGGCCH